MAKTTLTPLAGYVVIKRVEEASKTATGIFLTDSAKEKPQKGEVLAVGAGKEDKAPQVKVGQIVYFKKYGPTEIDLDGVDVLLLEEDDVLAILE
ncbi:MAG: co-chaperone GroES [Candidatus Gracilibacteria bacterium]